MVLTSDRAYVDTSVFGGVYDDEFRAASQIFIEQIRSGRFFLVTSPLVQIEVSTAPVAVRELFESMVP